QGSKKHDRPPRISCLPQCRRIRQHAIDSYRIGNVLDLAVAQRLIGTHQLVLNLLIDPSSDKELSRRRDSLKARCNVDSIAKNTIRLDNYIAKMNTNTI